MIIGYKTPCPFSTKEIESSVSYCLRVVKNWEKALKVYEINQNPFVGKHVVEIGPGPDLGTGIIILALGAKSYTAIDKNKLIDDMSQDFYNALLDHLKELPGYIKAKKTVDNIQNKNFNEEFRYIWDTDFSLQKFPEKKFDILVS